MLRWLSRMFSSLSRLFSPEPESPEEIIRRSIAEIRSRMPEINVHIARARENRLTLTEKVNSLGRQVMTLRRELEIRQTSEADEVALFELQNRLRELENSMETQGLLRDQADQDYRNMVRIKTTYEAKIRERVARALSSLQRAKAARSREEFLELANSLGMAGDLLCSSGSLEKLDDSLDQADALMELGMNSPKETR